MRFVIEYEGPIYNPAPAWHAAHQLAAADVGWSSLDRATFWRLTRTKGITEEILPAARDVKLKEYRKQFEARLESNEIIELNELHDDIRDDLTNLARHGASTVVTLGSNAAARAGIMQRDDLGGLKSHIDSLNPDPRRRPAELTSLAQGDRRTIVAAGTDAVIRSASDAGLFTVGISSGTCSVSRLHAAGAGVVYQTFGDLAESLRSGASDLIRAGLLPASLD